uniref:Secreted protein n=1 Tax=Trichuris muris TaxID=70415 RepID=A0A5S6QCW1_TRIMR
MYLRSRHCFPSTVLACLWWKAQRCEPRLTRRERRIGLPRVRIFCLRDTCQPAPVFVFEVTIFSGFNHPSAPYCRWTDRCRIEFWKRYQRNEAAVDRVLAIASCRLPLAGLPRIQPRRSFSDLLDSSHCLGDPMETGKQRATEWRTMQLPILATWSAKLARGFTLKVC